MCNIIYFKRLIYKAELIFRFQHFQNYFGFPSELFYNTIPEKNTTTLFSNKRPLPLLQPHCIWQKSKVNTNYYFSQKTVLLIIVKSYFQVEGEQKN